MLIGAAPGALLWPAAMIVWGPGYFSSVHAHHCVQLVMALRGTLRIRRNPADAWITCGAALVRPDEKHEVEARDTPVLIAFVESESELGAALSERVRKDITRISPRLVARWRAALSDGASLSPSRVEAWVRDALLGGRKSPRIHPRVKRVLRFLREQLGTPNDVSLENLASLAPRRSLNVRGMKLAS